MQKHDLDPSLDHSIVFIAYTNIKNTSEIHQKILDGSYSCCLVKRSMILDPFQLIIAANRALINIKNGTAFTKTVNSEIIYSLGPSKNITQNLKTFGIDESTKDAVACVLVDKTKTNWIDDVKAAVAGIDGTVDEFSLGAFERGEIEKADLSLIKNVYKVTDVEVKMGLVLDGVCSRIAAMDAMH